MKRKCGFMSIFLGNLELSTFPVTSSVEISLCIRYKTQIVTAFKFRLWMQYRRVPSFFRTKSIGEDHPVWAGWTMSVTSIPFTSCSSKSRDLSPARHGADCIDRLSGLSSSIWCCTALIQPSCPSHMFSTCVSMVISLLRYEEHLPGNVSSLLQLVFEIWMIFSLRCAHSIARSST